MKIFKSPDPSADSIQVGDRRYPVRGGVFSIKDPAAVALLVEQGFEEARGVADKVVAELDPVGEHVEPVEEPAPAAAVAASGAKADLGPLREQIAAAHDRIDRLEARLAEHGVFDDATGDAQPEDEGADTSDASGAADEADEPAADAKPEKPERSRKPRK